MDAGHVLVLDGDADRRERTVERLRAAGYRVVVLPDLTAAAGAVAEPGSEFLLLDLSLTDLDTAALQRVLNPHATGGPDALADAERRHIARVLRHTRGNRRQAAYVLGIARSTLLEKIRRYGLEHEGRGEG